MSTKTDAEWEEESFAKDLARAEKVKADPKKMAKARKGAKRIAKEEMVEAKYMQAVAKSKPPARIKGMKPLY